MDDAVAKSLISENLRAILRERGISCRELARLTGDPSMTVNDAVNGRRMPGAGLLKRMATALEVPVDDLYELRAEKTPALA